VVLQIEVFRPVKSAKNQ